MDKSDLKEIARQTETKLTESILRWKYRKQRKPVPADDVLERRSEQVRDEAHRIISEKGKRVWEEIRNAYRRGEGSKD
jgi:CHASE3 domain sensor protein